MWKVACVIAVIYAVANATPFDHLFAVSSDDDAKIFGEISVPVENSKLKKRRI